MRRDWLEIFTFLPDFAKELGAFFSSTAPPAVSRFVTPYLLAHEPERASIRHSRIQRPGGRRPGRLFLRARLVKRRGSTSDEMLRNWFARTDRGKERDERWRNRDRPCNRSCRQDRGASLKALEEGSMEHCE